MTEPPAALTYVAARVDERLAELLDAERRYWAELDPALAEPLGDLAELVLGGGKRVRPAYCHWGWVLGGGEPPGDADDAGCALELLHAFALIHDDVMDASPTRRNAPSVWQRFVSRHRQRHWQGEDRRFGEAAAVLVGDMAMVLADRTLGPVPVAARRVWDTLRTELNMGQYLDVAGTARGNVTAAQARTIIEHKTAGYTVVRPLQLGSALAGRDDLTDDLERHGRPIGVAFQLRDDLLGAFGDPASTGKPVGDDLRENKPTVLMALARERADAAQRAALDASGPHMDDAALAEVQQALIDTGARAAVEREIADLLDASLQALAALPAVPAAQEALAALARFVALRES